MINLFLNPNEDKTVKSTDTLNRVSKSFRNSSFFKRNSHYIKEGFEINPSDFKWEYQINYKKSLIVFKELDDCLDYYIYIDGECDILPIQTGYLIINKDHQKMNYNFCKSVENIITKLSKN